MASRDGQERQAGSQSVVSEKLRERVPRTVNRVSTLLVHSARKGPLGLPRRWPESVPRTVSMLFAE